MPKLYFSVEILKVLQKHGFAFVSRNGSHIKYRKTGNPTLTVIVPSDRKQIPSGTFHSILKQSELFKKDFKNSHLFFLPWSPFKALWDRYPAFSSLRCS